MTHSRHRQPESIRPMYFASSRHSRLPAEVVRRSEILSRFSLEFLRKPERLHFHLLIHCSAGEGAHWIDFERVRLLPGDLVYVAPGQVQQYDCSTEFESQMLVVPAATTLFSRPPLPLEGRSRLWKRVGPSVESSLDDVEREQERFDGTPEAVALIGALVEVMRCRLAFLERSGTSRSGLSSLCVAFEGLVDSAFHKQHSIIWYADQLACTTRTLARVVRQARGLSPKELVDARTILEAKRLLAYRNEKTAVLAEELGFLEATHFGRFFLRVAGETPAAFRKRWRGGSFGE